MPFLPRLEVLVSVQFEFSQIIDRSLDKVFRFYALERDHHHPRWDFNIHPLSSSTEPASIERWIDGVASPKVTHIDVPSEMFEFEPGEVFEVLTRGGPVVMRARVSFASVNDRQTRISTFVDIGVSEMDEETQKFLINRMERSGKIMKYLMETEISE
jgi:hypothetical protein